MHRDHHADGHYTGPDRRKLERRKMVLQEDDIGIIKSIVTDAVEEKVVGHCRYEIEPLDMRDLMEFVRSFREGAIETRRTFRTAAIRMVVWGSIAGFIGLLEVKFQWMRPLMRFITGAPH